ncbi:MAG: CHAD domain-containing protein, partial [Melioribacteraceae bacterium]|nr:CHAD domain-containing protein [Melioribacteraceae bacterium]
MNFQFELHQPIQDSVREIANQLIKDAISICKSEDLTHHEIIHSVRKSCKRIRGLLRIVRPNLGSTYEKENIFFRDLARTLSIVRDRQVLLELLEHYGNATDHIPFTTDTKTLIANFESEISNRKEKIQNWKIKFDGFKSIKGGIKKTYSRGKRAMQLAHTFPTVENYHEWRKRVKYHYYHLELLIQIWPSFMEPYVEQVHQLSEMLGKDHDL